MKLVRKALNKGDLTAGGLGGLFVSLESAVSSQSPPSAALTQ